MGDEGVSKWKLWIVQHWWVIQVILLLLLITITLFLLTKFFVDQIQHFQDCPNCTSRMTP